MNFAKPNVLFYSESTDWRRVSLEDEDELFESMSLPMSLSREPCEWQEDLPHRPGSRLIYTGFAVLVEVFESVDGIARAAALRDHIQQRRELGRIPQITLGWFSLVPPRTFVTTSTPSTAELRGFESASVDVLTLEAGVTYVDWSDLRYIQS